MSAATTAEVVRLFEHRGGTLDVLVDALQKKLGVFFQGRDESLRITSDILRRGVDCSHEFYFVAHLLMKEILSDAAFCVVPENGENLSIEHPLWEAGPDLIWRLGGFEDVPWGEREGAPIRENSVKSVNAVFTTLEEIVKSREGDVEDSSRRFFAIVNAYLPQEYRIDKSFISTKENWVSYKLSQLMYEAAKIVSGREDVLSLAGASNISPAIFTLGKLWDVETTYEKMAFYAGRFTKAFNYSAVDVGRDHAVIRIGLRPEYRKRMGPYYLRFVENSRDVSAATMAAVSSKVYGLDTHQPIETASMVREVPRDVITRVPRSLDRRVFGEIESRLSKGGVEDYFEIVYSWVPEATGWRRILVSPILAAAVVPPLLYSIWNMDGAVPIKVLASILSLSPPLIAKLYSNNLKMRGKLAKADEGTVAQVDEIELLKADYHRVELELRTKLSDRLITNAANLLYMRRYSDAAEEFSNYLRHTVDRRGLMGYSLAFFRTEGQLLLDVLGANIKVVAPGERLDHLDGLVNRFYFKRYPDIASARRAKNNSDLLRNLGALDIKVVFEDDTDHSGYVVTEEIHKGGRLGVRAPALLEMHEEGRMTGSVIKAALDVAARYYDVLWERRGDADFVEGSYDGDCARASAADLSETLRKCVGIKGSDEPLTAGLYVFTDDDRLMSDLETCLRKNAPHLLKIANSQKPGVAFDFTPRNLVYVSEGDQRLVDLDRINDLDMPRFFARFTEMGAFIKEEDVLLDEDVVVGKNTLYQDGSVVSSKNLLFCDFLQRLYGVADASLQAVIDSDAPSWLRDFPVARFSKALRHFGSFSHWSRKYSDQGDAEAARDAKRHALDCLDNVVSGLDDVIGSPVLGAEEKASASELRQAFASLVRHLGVYGLSSDIHVHGSLSHCVAKHYNDTPSPATPVDESLALVRSRIEGKLDTLKGRLEHVCIVEHTRFIEYGVPFLRYREMIEDVFARHRKDFARLSFGLELDLVGLPEALALDIAALDERAQEEVFRKKGISPVELSSADEILSSVDALHVGLHYRTFRSKQGYSIKSAEDYARALESSAKVLAGLKSKCNPSAFLLYVHQWKCAYDINKFNQEDGRPERISYPSAAQLEPFFRVMYDDELPFELNAKELSFVGDGACQASLPILSHAIEYYQRRNAAEKAERRVLFCRTSDIHNDVDRVPISLDSLYGMLPGLKGPLVVINR